MSNDWLNDLRKKMENHSAEVPDNLWKDIRYQLFEEKDSKTPIIPAKFNKELKAEKTAIKNNKVINRLYFTGGIAAAIALLFFTLDKQIDTIGNKNSSKESAYTANSGKIFRAKNSEQKKTIEAEKQLTKNFIGKKENIKTKENKTHQFSSKTTTKTYSDFKNSFWKKEVSEFQKDTNENLFGKDSKNTLQKNQLTFEQNSEVKEQTSTYELLTKEERELKENSEDAQKIILAENKSKKRWMVGFLTGNTSSSSQEHFPGYATLTGSTFTLPEVWSVGLEENPLMEILLANQDKKVDAKIKHNTPVTLGASVYYNIGKRWGIGTGINYTKLLSEAVSGSNDNFINSEQQIHYVGIPVQINYNIIQKGIFTGYIAGGVSLEKAVAGQIKTRYIVNGTTKEENKEEISEKPIQISATTAVGFQLKVFKHFGVYAEPGIGYHFNDGSNLKTIYKEKPVNFNMKLGIRVLLD